MAIYNACMDKTVAKSVDTATGDAAPAELSSARVKEIFSRIARRYEAFNAVSSFGAYRLWLAKLVRAADIGPADAVLDVAGGTGDVTFAVARAKKPAVIVCSDLVPEMLEVARLHAERGASEGVPVHFEVVDAQDIPYDDDTFDAITMAYGLRNMPERERALSEMLRVLRPGGQLACLDFSTPRNPAWKAAYSLYLRHMIPFWGKVVTGDDSGFVYLAKSIRAFPDQQGVADMMREAGFVDVKWQNCTGGIACIHTARKPKAEAEGAGS